MKEETRTIAVRLPIYDYKVLADALESSDHKRMSDLLRAVIHDWCEGWVNGE